MQLRVMSNFERKEMCDMIPDSESFRVYTRLEGNILISSACRYCTESEILPLVILDAGRLTKNSALRELAPRKGFDYV